MVNKGMDGWLFVSTKYLTENTPKYAKNDNLLQTKGLLKLKYKL